MKLTPDKVTCSRCGRRMSQDAPIMRNQWNADFADGVPVAFICPACQTDAENAEAEMNAATTVYSTDEQGRIVGRDAFRI